MRPRRDGIGRALDSVFASNGQIMPINLEALVEKLDEVGQPHPRSER